MGVPEGGRWAKGLWRAGETCYLSEMMRTCATHFTCRRASSVSLGDDEADEAADPCQRAAAERMGENDRPRCWLGQLGMQCACAEAVGADYFHLGPVGGPEQVDEVEQAQAGEGKGAGGAVAGGDDVTVGHGNLFWAGCVLRKVAGRDEIEAVQGLRGDAMRGAVGQMNGQVGIGGRRQRVGLV